ncbi:MAG: bifunctional 4-hydroxy-2-oxoglutarate aldolase/2-dehydro-3-deoxy-phosphogluconate aldolase [Oscillospiraceae bacterium]|nr:bifunctional 4-hydroxy-2-oxoglutarate aldolase/2-dehydro-3-deoxy-phosphogluconate aldolase [Oscillospiraceae bacterium]
MREQIIQKVLDKKIVAIVRGVYGEDCVNLAKALYAGGVEMMEVTFDQSKPEAYNRTSDTIAQLVQTMGDKMIFGAGTVTSLETLELAKNAGAKFVVSPDTNEAVIKATVAAGMVSMPGAMTPTEILTAHEYGADFVKVFPTSGLGASYIKAVCGPINHVRLLAVGGVSEKNVSEFLKAGCVGAGVGGNLVNKEWIKNGEFDKITALAKELMANAAV